MASHHTIPNFSGDIVTKDDPDYANAISRWSLTGQLEARFVLYPKDTSDVAAAVVWATGLGLPIAVKGGGHSASGASSIEDGVVIDLERHLGTVRVDASSRKAAIGGGALWATVNKETIKYGLASVGPLVSSVGIGGYMLGGGIGPLTSAVGLAIDNLLEVKLVTASGDTIAASDEENEDLFWAIRGGGGNFGIVTEFVVKLHPQRETVYSGVLNFPGTPETVKKIFDGAAEWYKSIGTKSALYISLAKPPDIGKPMAMVHIFHNGTRESGDDEFKWLFDLRPLNPEGMAEMSFVKASALEDKFAGRGQYRWMHSGSHYPLKNEISDTVYPKLMELDSKEGNLVNHAILVQYYNTKTILEVAANATAFPGRSTRCNMGLLTSWQSNHPAALEQAKQDLFELAVANGTPEGPEGVHYVGLDANDQRPPSEVAKVFKGNYPRLQRVKAIYDPNGVFSRWLGIEPVAP